eukprot:scaffold3702_cov126-Cylindrotheca_fusiformis.AAC.7
MLTAKSVDNHYSGNRKSSWIATAAAGASFMTSTISVSKGFEEAKEEREKGFKEAKDERGRLEAKMDTGFKEAKDERGRLEAKMDKGFYLMSLENKLGRLEAQKQSLELRDLIPSLGNKKKARENKIKELGEEIEKLQGEIEKLQYHS